MNPAQAQAAIALAKLAGAREALALVTKDADASQAGRKALLLCYVIAPEEIGTQRELARRLGVTEGRASQMLKVLRCHSCHNAPAWLTPR